MLVECGRKYRHHGNPWGSLVRHLDYGNDAWNSGFISKLAMGHTTQVACRNITSASQFQSSWYNAV